MPTTIFFFPFFKFEVSVKLSFWISTCHRNLHELTVKHRTVINTLASFTGILFIYKNRYTPLNTVTYWLVSLFVTFEINFGSDSLEALRLVIQRSHMRRYSANGTRMGTRKLQVFSHWLQFNSSFRIFVIQFFHVKAIVMICFSPKSAKRCHCKTWQRWNFCHMEGSPGPQWNYHQVLGELRCKNPFDIKPKLFTKIGLSFLL